LKQLLVFILIFSVAKYSQGQDIEIMAGLNYGGPLPTYAMDSTSGSPVPGFLGGISFQIKISGKLSFRPEICYSFRGVDYSQQYKKDTLVSIVINNVSGKVPSFYTANIDGGMRLHYIDVPLLLAFKIKKTTLLFGPYLSFLIAAKDEGSVRVVIGEGGFYDDYIENYENSSIIRKLEQGFILGIHSPVYKRISIETKFSRSFFSLYKPGSLPDNGKGENKLYNTFLHFSVCYSL